MFRVHLFMEITTDDERVVKQVTTLPWQITPKGTLYGPIYGIGLYMGYIWDRVYHIPFPC